MAVPKDCCRRVCMAMRKIESMDAEIQPHHHHSQHNAARGNIWTEVGIYFPQILMFVLQFGRECLLKEFWLHACGESVWIVCMTNSKANQNPSRPLQNPVFKSPVETRDLRQKSCQDSRLFETSTSTYFHQISTHGKYNLVAIYWCL